MICYKRVCSNVVFFLNLHTFYLYVYKLKAIKAHILQCLKF